MLIGYYYIVGNVYFETKHYLLGNVKLVLFNFKYIYEIETVERNT